MKRARLTYVGGALAFITIAFFFLNTSCRVVEPQAPVMSSHGWKVWFSYALQSFDTNGERVCVPRGFEPIGALRTGLGWAMFDSRGSGIFIRTSEFSSRYVMAAHGSYILRVVYPNDTPQQDVDQYIAIIQRAFDGVSTLYPRTLNGAVSYHTVLITVGVAGPGDIFETSVYPDPYTSTSILVHNLADERTEELYIHAVAHLYNRFREDLSGYRTYQTPFSPEDWEELEATWTEIIFRSTHADRADRLAELYAIHTSVLHSSYSPDLLYPFNIKDFFDTITKKQVFMDEDASYIDIQYGHYILGPLVMTAIDGLLQEKQTGIDLATILARIHTSKTTNFMDVLATYLSPEDMKEIWGWMAYERQIPEHLITTARQYYDARETSR